MRRRALAVILALPSVAFAQVCSPLLAGGTQLESARFLVGFRTEPPTLPVGRYFTVDVEVCPKTGQAAPESLAIEARMPEHGHGMNYQPQVTRGIAGHFRGAGLMFHMPGRWELIFDVRAGGKTDRLTHSVVVE